MSKAVILLENGEIFQHFGHSEAFKVYEAENGEILSSRIIGSNGTGHGALAELLAQQDIQVLICGGIGSGATAALSEAGVTVFSGAEGDADAAVQAFLRGELDNAGVNCDHHDHEEGEAEEYGISTFLYYRRQAFDIEKFDRYVNLHWPKEVIRCKGICYFSADTDMSYLFEQAGVQVNIQEAGKWYATAPQHELEYMLAHDAGLAHDWDEDYGDRMQKLVFIGQKMDKHAIIRALDECLIDG